MFSKLSQSNIKDVPFSNDNPMHGADTAYEMKINYDASYCNLVVRVCLKVVSSEMDGAKSGLNR